MLVAAVMETVVFSNDCGQSSFRAFSYSVMSHFSAKTPISWISKKPLTLLPSDCILLEVFRLLSALQELIAGRVTYCDTQGQLTIDTRWLAVAGSELSVRTVYKASLPLNSSKPSLAQHRREWVPAHTLNLCLPANSRPFDTIRVLQVLCTADSLWIRRL